MQFGDWSSDVCSSDLHFLGKQILGFNPDDSNSSHQSMVVQMLVFNTFVFAQIWNSFNSQRLDRKLNVFEGVMKNWYFIAITAIGSSLLPEAALFLISSYRACCPSPDMPYCVAPHVAPLHASCRPFCILPPPRVALDLSTCLIALGLLRCPHRIIVSPSPRRHVTFAASSHHLRLVVTSP